MKDEIGLFQWNSKLISASSQPVNDIDLFL
jgi:hypothetical protein